jgi:peptidoglycan/xylan/chitin deacetylase (PgdA/CDA1 family)
VKAILTYHSVDDSGSAISVTRAQLSQHFDLLEASGTRVVALASLFDAGESENAVAITFDDGFSNFASEAVPELQARSLTATVFVVPQYVGLRNEWERYDSRANVPVLPLMGWDEMRALDPEKVDVGAHGMSHRSLRGLPRDEIETELAKCAEAIETRLERKPASFAFPYGDFDDNAMAASSRIFQLACTTEFALVSAESDRRAIPRLDAYYFRDNDLLRRFGSTEFAAWVRVRRFARAARRRVVRPLTNG